MTDRSMTVAATVARRRSVRGFLDRPVDVDAVRDILVRAARAPSGGNLQPWHVHLVHGAPMTRLKALMIERLAASPEGEGAEYPVYPPELDSPYRERRYAVGEAMYRELAIPRADKPGRLRWLTRNYQFFGAPVGLFAAVDRRVGSAQWSDVGMYLQTVMLLLVEAGLDSCAQESWARYHRTVSGFLGLPSGQMLFCGMAIGHADPDDPVNRTRAERAPPEEWLTVHG